MINILMNDGVGLCMVGAGIVMAIAGTFGYRTACEQTYNRCYGIVLTGWCGMLGFATLGILAHLYKG